MSKQVFLNEETGEVTDHLGNPIGSVTSDLPSSNSMLLRGLGKVFDMFELDDDKILAFVKRHTVDRFLGNRIREDVNDDLDLGVNYDPRTASRYSVENFVGQKEREQKYQMNEIMKQNEYLSKKISDQEKILDKLNTQKPNTEAKKTSEKKEIKTKKDEAK